MMTLTVQCLTGLILNLTVINSVFYLKSFTVMLIKCFLSTEIAGIFHHYEYYFL